MSIECSEFSNKKNDSVKEKRKKIHIITGIIICILLISGGLIFTFYLKSNNADIAAPATPDLETGAEDWEGVKSPESNSVPEDGIRIPGYKSITIEADTTDVSVNFFNPEKNNCYFVIRLVLSETGETLYESKMIEPGKGLYKITLSRPLKPGTYKAQLQYEPYNMDNLARLNGASINLDLIVE